METETYNKARQIHQRIHAIMENIDLLETGIAALWGKKVDRVKLVNFFSEGVGNFPYKYAEIPSINIQILIDMLTEQMNKDRLLLSELQNEFKSL